MQEADFGVEDTAATIEQQALGGVAGAKHRPGERRDGDAGDHQETQRQRGDDAYAYLAFGELGAQQAPDARSPVADAQETSQAAFAGFGVERQGGFSQWRVLSITWGATADAAT